MKSWKGVTGVIGLVGLLLVSVVDGEGRGDKKVVEPDSTGDSYQPRTPEQARSELSERGIQYTQSSFFERVKKGICSRYSYLWMQGWLSTPGLTKVRQP